MSGKMFLLVMVAAGCTAINVGMYAWHNNPLNLAVGVFCGIMTVLVAAMWWDTRRY